MGGHHLSRVFEVGMVLVADKLVVLAVQAAEPVTDRQFRDYSIASR